jgi:DNA-binding transcriptional LysR family regulator
MEVRPGEMGVFLTLAEERHFGRTAERLRLTPSRVSQVVRGLEARLGCRLFDRTSRTVALTAAGQRLLDRVRPAWAEVEDALEQVRREASGITGTLRLGMHIRHNGGPHLDQINKAFEDAYPAARVDCLEIGVIADELGWLRRGDVDLLAIRLPVATPDVVIGPELSCEPMMAGVARDHPHAREESVTLDDLADWPVCSVPTLRAEMLDALLPPRTPNGRRLRRADVSGPIEALMRTARGETIYLVARGLFDHVHHPGIVAVPVRDAPPSRTALAWLARNKDPSVAAFAEVARSSSARLGG